MDFLNDATEILCAGSGLPYREVHAVLEDAESPITRKNIEKLYQAVLDRGHIDFDTIPRSKGDITKYSGYTPMMETLHTLIETGNVDKTYADIIKNVETIQEAIKNLTVFKPYYTQAYAKNVDVIILEYNTFVFTCIEATTTLLYQFVDFIRTPSSDILRSSFKNTKYRPDAFYFEQLIKFNAICKTGNYRKYLDTVVRSGKENFLGLDDAVVVGTVAVVSAVMLSIVPVTRALVYTFQDMRGKIAQDLELLAYYLELNKTVLDADKTRDDKELKKIKDKQEKLLVTFLRLAAKIRVRSLHAEELGKKNIENENKGMSMNPGDGDSDDDFSIL